MEAADGRDHGHPEITNGWRHKLRVGDITKNGWGRHLAGFLETFLYQNRAPPRVSL
jgi:hypothetical protein